MVNAVGFAGFSRRQQRIGTRGISPVPGACDRTRRCLATALVEKRLPYDVVFLLNHFFDAVAGAVVDTGGMPNQFVGDGMMAIFGIHAGAHEACSQGRNLFIAVSPT